MNITILDFIQMITEDGQLVAILCQTLWLISSWLRKEEKQQCWSFEMQKLSKHWFAMGYSVTRKITRDGAKCESIRRVITRPDKTIVQTFGDEHAALKREQEKAAARNY